MEINKKMYEALKNLVAWAEKVNGPCDNGKTDDDCLLGRARNALEEAEKKLEENPPPTLTVENSGRHGLSYCMTTPEDEDRFIDDETYQVAEETERIFILLPKE